MWIKIYEEKLLRIIYVQDIITFQKVHIKITIAQVKAH